jgi:hypothetical protein
MFTEKIYLPKGDDDSTPFVYYDLWKVGVRLEQIVKNECPASLDNRVNLLADIERNRDSHWSFGTRLYFKLCAGREECTVMLDISEAHKLDGSVCTITAVDGERFTTYQIGVYATWCSSEFTLTRAMVHVKLHQEAVQLMALLSSEFSGYPICRGIGKEVVNDD